MHQSGIETVNPPPDDIRAGSRGRPTAINVDPVERWISVIAGGALLFSGLRRRSLKLLLGGGVLLYRGGTGVCPVYGVLQSSPEVPLKDGLQLEETVTVEKSPAEVYALWRRLENLPRFMSHLDSVTEYDHCSRWVAKIPSPLPLAWEAAIVNDQANRKISWRSLPGSRIDHAGAVLFHAVSARNATVVKVIFSYRPPGGSAGAAIAKLLETVTERQIREDLRAFKAVAEAGEKPTIAGQSSGQAVR
jgi:uncharacterized membrane protein